MRHLEREFNLTLEARVAERTRIARELHDTLLQSVHGLPMQLVLAEKVPGGHIGIHGMRERAKLVGGSLVVWSDPGSGTEIELRIAASLASAAIPATPRRWFLRKPFGARRPSDS